MVDGGRWTGDGGPSPLDRLCLCQDESQFVKPAQVLNLMLSMLRKRMGYSFHQRSRLSARFVTHYRLCGTIYLSTCSIATVRRISRPVSYSGTAWPIRACPEEPWGPTVQLDLSTRGQLAWAWTAEEQHWPPVTITAGPCD